MMKSKMGKILLGAVLIMMLLVGIELGKTVQEKQDLKERKILTEEKFMSIISGKREIMNTAEGVKAYLIEADEEKIVLAISNHTGVKIHEVSIGDCRVNGQQVYMDSYLDGISDSTYILCTFWFEDLQYSLGREWLEGTLYVRGPEVYAVNKISVSYD